jgi:predicted transcriptional regulator
MKEITFRTGISKDTDPDKILSEYANLLSKIERKLFADITKGKNINDLKKEYIKKFEITARQFNSCKFELDGKIRSFNERKKIQIESLKQKISHIEKKLKKYKNKLVLHQKQKVI